MKIQCVKNYNEKSRDMVMQIRQAKYRIHAKYKFRGIKQKSTWRDMING